MKEELEKIAEMLRNWAEKYEKKYVSICFINKMIFPNLSPDDEDYEKLKFYK